MMTFLTLTAALLQCTGTKSIADVPLEAADPDAGDLSTWKNIKPGLRSGFGSVDVAYSKSIPPAGEVSDSIKLQGWKGERVHCQLLVWSPGAEEGIRITASGFSNDQSQIKPEQVTVSVVDYVLTDAFPGGIDRPDKTKFPVHLFPCWPADQDAAFSRMRAQGGFIVSASFKGGRVESATIESVARKQLVLLSPWKTMQVNGRKADVSKDGLVMIETKPGDVLVVSEGDRQ